MKPDISQEPSVLIRLLPTYEQVGKYPYDWVDLLPERYLLLLNTCELLVEANGIGSGFTMRYGRFVSGHHDARGSVSISIVREDPQCLVGRRLSVKSAPIGLDMCPAYWRMPSRVASVRDYVSAMAMLDAWDWCPPTEEPTDA